MKKGQAVRLQLDPASDVLPSGKRLSGGMSAVAAFDGALWLAHDETVSVEQLHAARTRAGALAYDDHRRFDLRSFVALAEKTPEHGSPLPPEADLEGLSYAEGYLWLAGSHSALRDGPEGKRGAPGIAALAAVGRSGNRFLLARIPVDAGTGGPTLVRRTPPSTAGVARIAARLPGGRKQDALTRALRDDPHLGPFLAIPSKDNGFDIEGLAAAPGGRLFLGLRGPVLDGWACILEIHVAPHRRRPDELLLLKLPRDAGARPGLARYRKHFLDLGGAGVRDLCFAGRDLLILTGPPMRGKGTSKLRCWHDALATRSERMLDHHHLPTLLELPYRAKKDHAEGIAVLAREDQRVLVMVIYDSADATRRLPLAAMNATLHELALAPPRRSHPP